MAKTTTYANGLLLLVFNNTALALIGDASGLQPSGTTGSLYVSLHTADPGISGDQTTSEAAYTSYARVAVARTAGGWTVSGATVSNTAVVSFPACTGSSSTVTFVGIGTATSGTGKLLYSFPLIQTYYDSTAKASTDVVTAPGHALLVNDPIQFVTAIGGTLPGSIVAGTTYFVKTVSSNDITISATAGGSTFDITSDGAALVGKISTLAVSSGITPAFAIGAFQVSES
jgi:hypothetical protein